MEMISWQLALALRAITSNILAPLLMKKQAERVDMHTRFFLQYVFNTAFTSILFVYFFEYFNAKAFLYSMGLGVVTVFGAFFYWKALAISGSKTSMFAFIDDIIAILLSVAFLGEWARITGPALVGILLCFIAVTGFVLRARARDAKGDLSATPIKLFLFVGLYSVTWGFSYFLQKIFAVQSIGMLNMVEGFYIGGLIVSWLILRFAYKIKREELVTKITALNRQDFGSVGLLSIILIISMCLQYTIFHGVIQLAAQPIFLVGEMVLQAFVFLVVFKNERAHFDRYEVLFGLIALLGTLMVMLFQS